jgi:hypothetical protein
VAVLPAHQIGRRPVLAEYLQNLGIAIRLSLAMPTNDQAITRLGSQPGMI